MMDWIHRSRKLFNYLLILPSASVCFALFHLAMGLACMIGSIVYGRGNGSTNPCFLAVTVGLEEIETFVTVIVVSV